ncbi:hypothetical protein L6Q79_09555 [bacterium]|nr:hypothetical protein [bacterium]NUN45254.1 hypothetical protein [bacterium]
MPTNPIEAAIRNHMQIDHATGSIALSDFFTPTARRIGIADHDFFEALFSVFSENSTPDQTRERFYQFGADWGNSFLERLKTQLAQAGGEHASEPQALLKDEFVEHLNSNFSYLGVGQFRILEGNKFYIIDLKNPWRPSDEHKQIYASTSFAGFFSTLFSGIAGRALSSTFLSNTPEHWRFALSTTEVIEDIRTQINAGLTEADILTQYHNQHLL